MKDKAKLSKGQIDKAEPFQSILTDEEESRLAMKQAGKKNMEEGFLNANIQFRHINPNTSYDGSREGLLNADEEHTTEEIQNSRGFYKRMTLEEAKGKGFITDEQIYQSFTKDGIVESNIPPEPVTITITKDNYGIRKK